MLLNASCELLNRISYLCIRINEGTGEMIHVNWEPEKMCGCSEYYGLQEICGGETDRTGGQS